MDVKDDNPPPKVMPSVFNRSILILTPQRALKFTAITAERHYLWLTALSFLAHSSQAVPDILPAPQLKVKQQPLPEFESSRTRFRRGGIRDSIRLAKGRSGNFKTGAPAIPSLPGAPSSKMGDVASFRLNDSLPAATARDSPERSQEAAEALFIPRFSERANLGGGHGRKRSNTGGHVAPLRSFRGFSGPQGGAHHHHSTNNSTADASIGTANSSDMLQSQASSHTTWNMAPTSQPPSEASSRPRNFFDAIGTVRMEAFISPLSLLHLDDYPYEHDEYGKAARQKGKELRRRYSWNRARGRGGSGGQYDAFRARAVDEDWFREDPFQGF